MPSRSVTRRLWGSRRATTLARTDPAARGGVQPILCVNKMDLGGDSSAVSAWREMGVPVVLGSTLSGAGVDEIRDLLAGNLSVLAGHSGVGKSSLLNALADERHAPRPSAIS